MDEVDVTCESAACRGKDVTAEAFIRTAGKLFPVCDACSEDVRHEFGCLGLPSEVKDGIDEYTIRTVHES